MTSASSARGGRTSVRTALARPVRLLVMVLGALALVLSFVVPSAVAISPPAPPGVTEVVDSATSLKVSWTAVTGAKGYRIQYSTSSAFSSPKHLPAQPTSAPITDTSAVVSGLRTGTTYYFRVATVHPGSLKVLSDSYSKAVSAVASYPYSAPGDLVPTRVTKATMTLTWAAVRGAPGYTVRVATSAGTRSYQTTTNSLALSGLKANTLHRFQAYVAKGSTVLSAVGPENQVMTSTYATPSPDAVRVTSQAPWSLGLAWHAVTPLPAGARYMISLATEFVYPQPGKEPPAPSAVFKNFLTRGPFTTPSATVGGLGSNKTYYAQVYLVDAAKKRIGGSSAFVVAKTIVPRGVITGKTSGVTGNDLTASAFTPSGELVTQVTVGSDNAYSLSLRPGSYKVMITYTGSGNYSSAWARAGRAGGRQPSEASTVTVALGKKTSAPAVKIRAGGVVPGLVRDRSGRAVRDVDVTAITFMNSAREVEVIGRSDAKGRYVVRGLPDGRHWLRYAYSGDGFKTRSVEVWITKGKITSVRVSTSSKASTASVKNPFTKVNVRLDNATFRKRYKAYISGTKRVGYRLRAKATPWLAGSYPTTRASMSLQWKRNGKAIKGATKSTYTLKAADRGRRITVTASARRYGYTTGSTTSKRTAVIR